MKKSTRKKINTILGWAFVLCVISGMPIGYACAIVVALLFYWIDRLMPYWFADQ